MMILGQHIPFPAVLSAGLAAAVAAALLLAWAARTAVKAYRRLEAGQRARTRESLLLALVWGSAATLSASNVIGYARITMHLTLPMAVLFFAALDGAAAILLSILARRAANHLNSAVTRAGVWALLAASAITNWMHAPHSFGAHVLSAIMPFIAGGLAELWLHEVRTDSRHARPRIADRQVPWTAWLNPADAIAAVRMLQSDPDLPYADAMLAVRTDRAAAALYRLRAAIKTHSGNARHVLLRSTRIDRAERRALGCLQRTGFTDDGITALVLRQLQMRVLVREFAMLDYSTPAAANAAIATLIKGETPKQPKDHRQVSSPSPSPVHNNDRVVVLIRGGKKKLARDYWDQQIAMGKAPLSISATDLAEAAGAAPKSSSGRQWRGEWLNELGIADDSSDSDSQEGASV